MKKIYFLRLIPFVFLLLMIGQFLIMQIFSEPYPAVILPPFKETSSWDTLRSGNFSLLVYGEDSEGKKVDYKKVFKYAPESKSFYMLRSIPDDKPTVNKIKEKNSIKSKIENILFSRRHKALQKSSQNYNEVISKLENCLKYLAGIQPDRLIIYKTEKINTWRGNLADSSFTPVKTLRF